MDREVMVVPHRVPQGFLPVRKGGVVMAQREYKQLNCRDAGADCDFLIRAETVDEVMNIASEHACQVHHLCEITPEFKKRMESITKSICCEGECRSAPMLEMHIPAWG